MSAEVVERQWAMMKVGRAGDYLLPSNDRKTLWRIVRYHEDGSLEVWIERGKTRPVKGWFWALWTYTKPIPEDGNFPAEMFDEALFAEYWQLCEDGFHTREEAIGAAMGAK